MYHFPFSFNARKHPAVGAAAVACHVAAAVVDGALVDPHCRLVAPTSAERVRRVDEQVVVAFPYPVPWAVQAEHIHVAAEVEED